MANIDYLNVSDGTGDVPLITLTGGRSTGSTVFSSLSGVSKLPAKFIATVGTKLSTGFIDPTTKMDFMGHTSGATIVIDSIAPGNADLPNTTGQVIIVRPNTYWADIVADFLQAQAQRATITTASSSTPTPNVDTTDVYALTALAANATFGAPTGTPTDGMALLVRIKDNGTARTLSFNAIYRAVGTPLPTTTVVNKTMYLGFIYNSAASKWDFVSLAQEA